MSDIFQNISDIFSIISLVFSIICGKSFTMRFFIFSFLLQIFCRGGISFLRCGKKRRIAGCHIKVGVILDFPDETASICRIRFPAACLTEQSGYLMFFSVCRADIRSACLV